MAPTTPTGEPTRVTAGDSWTWKQTFNDYPDSEGWTLSYVFAGPGLLTTQSSEITDDGGVERTVVIPASRTADLPVGTYSWAAHMTGAGSYAGQRYTVSEGTLVVEVNHATATEGDLELPEEKQLAAVNAVISGRITDDVQQVMIAGRSVVLIPIMELFTIKSRLVRSLAMKRSPSSVMRRVVFR